MIQFLRIPVVSPKSCFTQRLEGAKYVGILLKANLSGFANSAPLREKFRSCFTQRLEGAENVRILKANLSAFANFAPLREKFGSCSRKD